MPTIGFFISSSVNPSALNKLLCGACCREGRPAMEEADYVLLDRELFLTKEEMESRDAATKKPCNKAIPPE